MLKVFLVEDEIIVRNAIKNNISWEEEGFEFVGEAGDGELAYPMIQRLHPDILITDIKMPFMDGLELSRIVREKLPHIKIMILSGHESFSYAQEAIRLGVAAYLLKPIDAKKFLEELTAVAEKLNRERACSVSEVRGQSLEIQEKMQEFFIDLVSGTIGFREAMERGMEFGMDFVSPYFQIMRLGLFSRRKGDEQQENLKACQKELRCFLADANKVRAFEVGMEGWNLILLKDTPEESDKLLEWLEKNIKLMTRRYGHVEWFAGIGNVVERVNQLSQSYKLAGKAYASRFYLKENQILNYKKVESQFTDNQNWEFDKTDVLVPDQKSVEVFLRRGVKNEIGDFVEEYLSNIGENNLKSLLFRQYIIMNCYFSICNFLKIMGIEDEQTNEFYNAIRNSITVQDVRRYLSGSLKRAMELRDSRIINKGSELLVRAQRYIKKHYKEDSLSLNLVAEYVHVTPSYLSKIFRQEMESTFVEYLTALRIEAAKELLVCTNMKIVSIAFEVGYKDSGYFCQLFKKHVGCTMKEYREGRSKDD